MILTLIIFLAVLSILILAHELGHFFVAKKVGIRVQEFGLGYPPRLWKRRVGKTIYSLNALPFGGFVKLYGEELAEKVKVKKEAFWAKSKKAKTAVIVSGVLANFILAVIVFSIVYSVAGIPTKTGQIRIMVIAPDSPADKMGLKEDDIIIEVDSERLNNLNYFTELIDEKKGSQIKIVVERERDNPCLEKVLGAVGFSCQDGQLVFLITPRETPPEGEGPLGVIVSDMTMVHYPFWQMPFRGAEEGFREAFAWTALVVGGLGKMLADLVTQGAVPKDIAGPIGILQITSGVAQSGVLAVLQFIGILSVNLAVINIFPFPALDGGRLLFVAYEAITGKRAHATFERWVHTVGMIILLLLILLVTINDISRALEASPIGAQLRTLWPF